MAVRQPPRPMPSPQGESLFGASVIDYVKTQFRAIGPPRRGDENRAAYMEQVMPTVNAITLLNQTGTVQGSQLGLLLAVDFSACLSILDSLASTGLPNPCLHHRAGNARQDTSTCRLLQHRWCLHADSRMQAHQIGHPNNLSHHNLAGTKEMTRGEQQLNRTISYYKIPKDRATTHGNGTATITDKVNRGTTW